MWLGGTQLVLSDALHYPAESVIGRGGRHGDTTITTIATITCHILGICSSRIGERPREGWAGTLNHYSHRGVYMTGFEQDGDKQEERGREVACS